MPFLESKAARTSSSRPWRAERARTASAEGALGRVATLGDTQHATSQAYGYDDQGLRIKITDSVTGKVSYHLYDEARHLIAEYEVPSGGALTWKKDILYVGDKEVAEVDGTHTWVAFLDHLGSPRYQWDGTAVTKVDGVHLIAQKYAPFGEYLNDPTTQQKFAKGFTNHEQTDASGLIYMQARFYAPMYGRFLSPDPARDQHFEETQSWNIYSYVKNDPTMRIDPTGLINFSEIWQRTKNAFNNMLDGWGGHVAAVHNTDPATGAKTEVGFAEGHIGLKGARGSVGVVKTTDIGFGNPNGRWKMEVEATSAEVHLGAAPIHPIDEKKGPEGQKDKPRGDGAPRSSGKAQGTAKAVVGLAAKITIFKAGLAYKGDSVTVRFGITGGGEFSLRSDGFKLGGLGYFNIGPSEKK